VFGPSAYRGDRAFLRPAGRPGVSAVLDGELLVGEYPTPGDAPWLRDEHGIAAVVSLQDDADLASKDLAEQRLVAAYAAAGLEFHRIPVVDGDAEHLAAQLPRLLALLAALIGAGKRVYVHCNGGYNRAPTVAIAYLRAHRGLTHEAAWQHVKARRSCVPYRRALELHFGDDGAR
jgi:protein-tyrosine phosphatase